MVAFLRFYANLNPPNRAHIAHLHRRSLAWKRRPRYGVQAIRSLRLNHHTTTFAVPVKMFSLDSMPSFFTTRTQIFNYFNLNYDL